MRSQNSQSIVVDFEPTARVLALIRESVQRACDHAGFRPIAVAATDDECTNCGRQLGVLQIATRVNR